MCYPDVYDQLPAPRVNTKSLFRVWFKVVEVDVETELRESPIAAT